MIKNLLIIGNDKISGEISIKITNNRNCIVYIDKSSGFFRIIRLLKKRVLSPTLLMKMFFCELLRKGNRPNIEFPSMRHHGDLLKAIEEHKPDRLILFRAGLIINKSIIDTGIPVLNIHAATVPDYGGIGSIARAIRDKAYNQYASLHVVTNRIDDGEVVDCIAYTLSPTFSYCQNENVAYKAAQQLFLKTICK